MKLRNLPHSLRMLILISLLICIVPMSMLVLHLHSITLDSLQEAVVSSAQSETTFYAQMLNDEFSNIQLRQHQLISSENVKRLNVLYGLTNMSEQASLVRDNYDQLITRMNLSEMIQQSVVYLPNHMRQLSSSAYFVELTQSGLEDLQAMVLESRYGFHIAADGITLLSGYPVNAAQDYSNASLITTAYLSRDRISQRLSEHADLSHSTAFVLVASLETLFWSEGQQNIALLASSLFRERLLDGTGYFTIDEWDVPQIVTFSSVGTTGMSLLQITPQNRTLGALLRYKSQIPLLIGVMLGVTLLLTLTLYKVIYGPITASRIAFRKAGEGDFNYRLGHTWTAEFQTMFDQFNQMAQSLQTHIEREQEFQQLASEAEIKQLQYQISPHFLYNSYFILRGMLIQQDFEQASELAALMGRYLKYIVHVESPYAQLQDEITHACAYADIQKIRFGNRISVEFDVCPEALKTLRIPRLILQPLIENAFVHGVRNVLEGGIVAIHFFEDERGLDIIVEDNGTELSDSQLETLQKMMCNPSTTVYTGGIAIKNIHRRILLTYGEAYGLQVDRSPLGGLRCTLRIGEKTYVQDTISG